MIEVKEIAGWNFFPPILPKLFIICMFISTLHEHLLHFTPISHKMKTEIVNLAHKVQPRATHIIFAEGPVFFCFNLFFNVQSVENQC